MKRLECFQGKQEEAPPDNIINILEDYMDKNKKEFMKGKSCKDIRKLKSNKDKKKYITLIEFEKIFKKLNEATYIKDIEYMYNKLFGYTLLNLNKSQYAKIIEDYITVQKTYNDIKKRDSNINLNLILVYHLSIMGIKVDKDDIKIIKSKESLEYHKNIFKIITIHH